MAKKRKTRQEKIIADLRRKLATTVPQESSAAPSVVSTYSLPQVKTSTFVPTTNPSASLRASNQRPIANYTYVLSDLRKTALLTGIALAAQIVLYFVLVRG